LHRQASFGAAKSLLFLLMVITIFDYLLLPVYIFLFYIIVKRKTLKYEAELKKYIQAAFFLRMLGSVAYCLVLQYYYGFGDSFIYYSGGNFISEQLGKDLSNIHYLFVSGKEVQDWYNSIVGDINYSGYFEIPSAYMIMKISAVLSFLSFNKFMIISLFFGFFSFAGQWKLFMVFDKINNHQRRKLLAYAVLYTPSIWFWGSGLMKDSVCLGALGFIISILYTFFVKRKFSLLNLIFLGFLIYLVYTIKSYIIAIFFISLGALFFNYFIRAVKSIVFRIGLFILLILASIVIVTGFNLSNQINELQEESIAQRESNRSSYQASMEESETSQAGIESSELDPSIANLLLNSPGIIFTCLFRPFIWESRKIMILFTSLESMLLLFCTIYLLVKMKIIGLYRLIFHNHYLFFCFTISMLFAMIIGFTTFNFGTMIRYKIILLPFYYFMLVQIYNVYKNSKPAIAK